MFKLLTKGTDKLIKISQLDMGYVDAAGKVKDSRYDGGTTQENA